MFGGRRESMIVLFGKELDVRPILIMVVFIGSLLIISWNIFHYFKFDIPLLNVHMIIALFLIGYSSPKVFRKKP